MEALSKAEKEYRDARRKADKAWRDLERFAHRAFVAWATISVIAIAGVFTWVLFTFNAPAN